MFFRNFIFQVGALKNLYFLSTVTCYETFLYLFHLKIVTLREGGVQPLEFFRLKGFGSSTFRIISKDLWWEVFFFLVPSEGRLISDLTDYLL